MKNKGLSNDLIVHQKNQMNCAQHGKIIKQAESINMVKDNLHSANKVVNIQQKSVIFTDLVIYLLTLHIILFKHLILSFI